MKRLLLPLLTSALFFFSAGFLTSQRWFASPVIEQTINYPVPPDELVRIVPISFGTTIRATGDAWVMNNSFTQPLLVYSAGKTSVRDNIFNVASGPAFQLIGADSVDASGNDFIIGGTK